MAHRVIGYTRVSCEEQVEHGVSLDAQRAKLEAYCALYDLDLVAVIEDAGVSAKTLKRPGLHQALAMLKSGKADALLVAKLDRLSRSIKDFGTLIETYFASKYALLSVSDQVDTRTAAGRLVLNVLMSVFQWEREAIGERTREAMAHKRTKHQRISRHLPYGYRLDSDGVTLVEDLDEQAVIAAARHYAGAGLSLRGISARLAEDGYVSRTGKPFAPKVINTMLRTVA